MALIPRAAWAQTRGTRASFHGTECVQCLPITMRTTPTLNEGKQLTARYCRSLSIRSASLYISLPRWEASMLRHGDPSRKASRAAFTARSTSAWKWQKYTQHSTSPDTDCCDLKNLAEIKVSETGYEWVPVNSSYTHGKVWKILKDEWNLMWEMLDICDLEKIKVNTSNNMNE